MLTVIMNECNNEHLIIRKDDMKMGRQLQYYLARIYVKRYASILYSTWHSVLTGKKAIIKHSSNYKHLRQKKNVKENQRKYQLLIVRLNVMYVKKVRHSSQSC